MIDTILFDLDGTLLPMEQEPFMKLYLGALAKKCAPHGYQDTEAFIAAVWAGTKAMVTNDGTLLNRERFWQAFETRLGSGVYALEPVLDGFYTQEFHTARAATRPNPAAATLVRELKAAGKRVVLATNPLFPEVAVRSRLGWIDLAPEDFDRVTTYDNSHYCKPNTAYYSEILAAVGAAPETTLMVGNDVVEDGAATALGIGLYLVTDDLLCPAGQDIAHLRSGNFADCVQYLRGL